MAQVPVVHCVLDSQTEAQDKRMQIDGVHVCIRAAILCHVILCHDMTICHDMKFISEIVIYHCMKQVISDSLT